MKPWKILITDGLSQKGIAILAEEAEVALRDGISAEELLIEIGGYDAVIVRSRTKVTQSVLKAGVNLKVVGRAGVGVDNIDIDAAARQGVIVVNSPTATTITVAELTLGLMLSLAREIPRADAAMKNGVWLKKELVGVELYGKTLGIVGFGRIGSQVAQRAKAFGMRVIAYDPLISDEEIVKRGAEPVALNDLYARTDFLTLHIPLTDETKNMLNAEAFAKMRKGVRIICAARGGVIDEDALLAALESGQVAGAALDVFTQEPPGKSALVSHPQVIATPHIGAQTKEAGARAAVDIAEEVVAALKGQPLRWRVV